MHILDLFDKSLKFANFARPFKIGFKWSFLALEKQLNVVEKLIKTIHVCLGEVEAQISILILKNGAEN